MRTWSWQSTAAPARVGGRILAGQTCREAAAILPPYLDNVPLPSLQNATSENPDTKIFRCMQLNKQKYLGTHPPNSSHRSAHLFFFLNIPPPLVCLLFFKGGHGQCSSCAIVVEGDKWLTHNRTYTSVASMLLYCCHPALLVWMLPYCRCFAYHRWQQPVW